MKPDRNAINQLLQQWVDADPQLGRLFNTLVMFKAADHGDAAVYSALERGIESLARARFIEYAITVALSEKRNPRVRPLGGE